MSVEVASWFIPVVMNMWKDPKQVLVGRVKQSAFHPSMSGSTHVTITEAILY